ncbi:hypothetical protein [Arthrobacter sp. ISL-30]|uniref:hypothetical protein n=1 Tax=Arthrobacter sp. ISL-30 TaxID=2819109 RepID=UPI001BEA28ED|nr:hypothetical protein [Arthrobacter sp. ISL-30]MBT2513646.1 hypothetical protein [Arthrobacter sp. ISL-30]
MKSKSGPPNQAHGIDARKDSMAQRREQAVAGVMSGLIFLGEEAGRQDNAIRRGRQNVDQAAHGRELRVRSPPGKDVDP